MCFVWNFNQIKSCPQEFDHFIFDRIRKKAAEIIISAIVVIFRLNVIVSVKNSIVLMFGRTVVDFLFRFWSESAWPKNQLVELFFDSDGSSIPEFNLYYCTWQFWLRLDLGSERPDLAHSFHI